MSKTYNIPNDVKSSFKRMLRNVAENADLRWTEQNTDETTIFEVTANQNVIDLIDKFHGKMNTVRMVVHTKSKFHKDLNKIAKKLNTTVMQGTEKNYYIIILQRHQQDTLKSMMSKSGISGSVSCDGVCY